MNNLTDEVIDYFSRKFGFYSQNSFSAMPSNVVKYIALDKRRDSVRDEMKSMNNQWKSRVDDITREMDLLKGDVFEYMKSVDGAVHLNGLSPDEKNMLGEGKLCVTKKPLGSLTKESLTETLRQYVHHLNGWTEENANEFADSFIKYLWDARHKKQMEKGYDAYTIERKKPSSKKRKVNKL
jgi:hypothetical protein